MDMLEYLKYLSDLAAWQKLLQLPRGVVELVTISQVCDRCRRPVVEAAPGTWRHRDRAEASWCFSRFPGDEDLPAGTAGLALAGASRGPCCG